MHRSQGFGNFGGGGGGGSRTDAFTLLAGEPAKKDILDGVDTTWARVPGGADVGHQADEAIAKFDLKDPAASVPALLTIRKRLSSIAVAATDPIVKEKSRQLDRAIQACLGLVVETSVPRAEVVPGEVLTLRHVATVAANVPVRWLAVRYPLTGQSVTAPIDLHPGHPATREEKQVLPAAAPLTQPYWLRNDHSVGMYTVEPGTLIGRPENPQAFPVEHEFQVGDQTLEIADVVVQSAAKGEPARQLDVIAPVALRYLSDVRLFAPGSERPVEVEVTAARDHVEGTLDLDVPDGWTSAPATQPFRLATAGASARLTFTVRAPAQAGSAGITARAHVGNATWTSRASYSVTIISPSNCFSRPHGSRP